MFRQTMKAHLIVPYPDDSGWYECSSTVSAARRSCAVTKGKCALRGKIDDADYRNGFGRNRLGSAREHRRHHDRCSEINEKQRCFLHESKYDRSGRR